MSVYLVGLSESVLPLLEVLFQLPLLLPQDSVDVLLDAHLLAQLHQPLVQPEKQHPHMLVLIPVGVSVHLTYIMLTIQG